MIDDRISSHKRGYDYRWKVARDRYINDNPLCVMCKEDGHVELATTVDHKIKVENKHDPLFWDETNWQALCTSHHNSTKQSEDRRGYGGSFDDDGFPIDVRHPMNRGR